MANCIKMESNPKALEPLQVRSDPATWSLLNFRPASISFEKDCSRRGPSKAKAGMIRSQMRSKYHQTRHTPVERLQPIVPFQKKSPLSGTLHDLMVLKCLLTQTARPGFAELSSHPAFYVSSAERANNATAIHPSQSYCRYGVP